MLRTLAPDHDSEVRRDRSTLLIAMVSHQPPGSEVKMGGASRAGGRGRGERREGDSVYQSHPLPYVPPLTSRSRPSADSMLAYTERMRQISKFRTDSAAVDGSSPETILEIQARHIPKTGQGQFTPGSRKPQQRRPLSLDELIGRPKKDEASTTSTDRQKERRMSEPFVIPSVALASKQDKEKEEKRIRINFVNASDLFDLVDFSLRRKKSDHGSIQLARAQDALRLIRNANFFRSTAGGQRVKPGAEKEAEVDRASLVVQGMSSPRDNSQDSSEISKERHGQWARKVMADNSYDSDDEDDEEDRETDRDWPDHDLIQNKRMMLLQPQKLHFRPKRAKRMKLHRSLLSAIPEDERQRRVKHSASLQDTRTARVPIIPSAASLTAIKGSKQLEPVTLPDTEMKKTTRRKERNTQRSSDEELRLQYSHPKNKQETCTSKETPKKRYVEVAENSSQKLPSELPHKEQHLDAKVNRLHSSQKTESLVRTAAGSKTSSLRGRSISLEASDMHHRKIRKIIFLKDLPEPSSHRHS